MSILFPTQLCRILVQWMTFAIGLSGKHYWCEEQIKNHANPNYILMLYVRGSCLIGLLSKIDDILRSKKSDVYCRQGR